MTNARMAALIFMLGLGFGAAVTLTEALTTKGPLILIPYGLLVVVTALVLRAAGVASFARRFAVAAGAFMVATLIVFAYIVLVANPAALSTPLWNKVWPLAMMAATGAVLGAGVAAVSRPRAA